MTVTYKGNGIYHGLAADTKPSSGIVATALFLETDTKIWFWWTGTGWTNRPTIISQAIAGSAETLVSWTIGDTANASKVDIVNASSTDGVLAPWLRSFNLDDAAHPALYIYGYIGNAHDSGTQAGMRFDVRKNDNSALTTRPLFDFRTAATSVFKINAKGDVLHLPIATTGVAETIAEFRVSDVNSYLRIINGSATDARFLPQITARQVEDAAFSALSLQARIEVGHDSGTVPATTFDSRTQSDTAIATRPLFSFRNAGTEIMGIKAKGDILYNIISTASTAELLSEWKVSDNATAYLRFDNASSTDAIYIPRIRAYNFGAGTSSPGFELRSYVNSGENSGSTPIMILDSRLSTDTEITSARPLFRLRNAGTPIVDHLFYATDLYNRELRNFYVMDKVGQYSCSSMYGVDVWGLLEDLQGYGTFSKNLDATGSGHLWDTGTTAGVSAGVAKIGAVGSFQGWMRSAFLPFVRGRIITPAYTSGDSRFYFGWYTEAGVIAQTDTPMDVNKGGILIGYRSTDTNWQVFRGPADGSTSPTVTDTGYAIQAAATAYFFEIRVASATSITVTIYSSGGTVALYTGTFTTNLPAGTKSLNFHSVMQNVTAVNKRLTFYSLGMRASS